MALKSFAGFTGMLTLLFFSALTQAQTNELGWTLDSALKQIDRQADDFDTAMSDFTGQWSDAYIRGVTPENRRNWNGSRVGLGSSSLRWNSVRRGPGLPSCNTLAMPIPRRSMRGTLPCVWRSKAGDSSM